MFRFCKSSDNISYYNNILLRMIYLIVYIVNDCETCNRVVTSARKAIVNLPKVELKVKNINELNKNLAIVPAVFINNHLYCYGDFDSKKLLETLNQHLINANH